jgi:hypothetical protein
MWNSMTFDNDNGLSSLGGSEGISVKQDSETHLKPTFAGCSSSFFFAELMQSLMLMMVLLLIIKESAI